MIKDRKAIFCLIALRLSMRMRNRLHRVIHEVEVFFDSAQCQNRLAKQLICSQQEAEATYARNSLTELGL